MVIKLEGAEKRELLSKPENGMGYQIADATLNDNSTKRGVVLNAELFVTSDDIKILSASYLKVLGFATSSAGVIKSLSVPGVKSISLSMRDASRKVEEKAASAKDGPQ